MPKVLERIRGTYNSITTGDNLTDEKLSSFFDDPWEKGKQHANAVVITLRNHVYKDNIINIVQKESSTTKFRFIVGDNHIYGQQDVPGLRELLSKELLDQLDLDVSYIPIKEQNPGANETAEPIKNKITEKADFVKDGIHSLFSRSKARKDSHKQSLETLQIIQKTETIRGIK